MIENVLEEMRLELRLLGRLEKEGELWFTKEDEEKCLSVEQTLATKGIPYEKSSFKNKIVIEIA